MKGAKHTRVCIYRNTKFKQINARQQSGQIANACTLPIAVGDKEPAKVPPRRTDISHTKYWMFSQFEAYCAHLKTLETILFML